MEIKWYWFAEQMGLVEDVSHLYSDGTTYQVSADTGEVFGWIAFSLIPLVLLIGFLLRFFTARRRGERTAQMILRTGIGMLLLYALLLAVGIGPYIEFYPQGSGFLDLSGIEHILEGIFCAFLALMLYLGGRLGHIHGYKRPKKPLNTNK